MATDPRILQTRLNVTHQEANKLRGLFGTFYDEESKKNRVDEAPDPEYPTVEKFVDHLYEVGMPQTSIKNMGIILEWNYENPTATPAPEYSEGTTTMTGAPESPVSKTSLNAAESEELIRKYEEREAERVKAVSGIPEAVQASLDRQKQIYDKRIEDAETAKEKLEKENKNVYAQVEKEPETTLTKDQQAIKQEFVDEIKKNPDDASKFISEKIQSRIKDVPQGAADDAADEIVSSVAGTFITPVHIAVAEAAKSEPEISAMAEQIAIQEKAKKEVADLVVAMAFGEELKKDLLPSVKVNISETPKADYQPSSLAYIPTRFIEITEDQKTVLDNPTITKPEWMKSWTDRQIEMAKKGIQGRGSFNEELVQGYFATYMYMPSPETSWQASDGPKKFDIATGAAEPFKLVGGLAKQAGIKIATKGAASVVAKTGLKAAFSKLTAALGSIGGPVTAALGWLGGEVIGKLLAKAKDLLSSKNIKEWSAAVVGGLSFLIALPLGIGTALGVGLLTTGASMAFGAGLGSITLGGIGSGLFGLIGAIGGATLGAIGTPILVTLIGFPVAIALILFIINSGAYVVPPSPLTNNPFGPGGRPGIPIVCSTDKGPVGVSGPSSSSPIANRAWKITYDLYQGFWCFWNRSPSNVPWNGPPRPDFPNDVVKYPPNYPNLFDYSLFANNKNPSEASGPNLFWCTDLVIKAYKETGHDVPNELGVTSMHDKWPGKIIAARDATAQNIVPGSAVFFRVPSNGPGLQHVGVVYSVSSGGIVEVESNNAVKSESINFNAGGVGVGSLPGMPIDSFGLP